MSRMSHPLYNYSQRGVSRGPSEADVSRERMYAAMRAENQRKADFERQKKLEQQRFQQELALQQADAEQRERQAILQANLSALSGAGRQYSQYLNQQEQGRQSRRDAARVRDWQAEQARLKQIEDARQFDASLGEEARQFDYSDAYRWAGLNEDARQFDVAQDERVRQFDLGTRLDYDRLGEQRRQFGLNYDLDRDQFQDSQQRFAAEQQRLQQAADDQRKLSYDRMGQDAYQFDRQFAEQAARDQRLYDQSLQELAVRDQMSFDREGVAQIEDGIGQVERQLNQAELTPQGAALRSELQSKLQSIRKQRGSLRPTQYQELLQQWGADYQLSGIQNHVQQPPDPYEIYGGFRQNPETGELEFNQGKNLQYLPTGQIAIPDGKGGITTRDIPSAVLERVSPRALAKMLQIPESDVLPSGVQAQSGTGFDSKTYRSLADSVRKRMSEPTYDENDRLVRPQVSEADVQREVRRQMYAERAFQEGPAALLDGLNKGELTIDDIRGLGFGDQVSEALRQGIQSGQINPQAAQVLGFDVSITEHGVGVRMRDPSQGGRQPQPQPGTPAPQRMEQRSPAAQEQAPVADQIMSFRPDSVSDATRQNPMGQLALSAASNFRSSDPREARTVRTASSLVLMLLDQYGDPQRIPPQDQSLFAEAMRILEQASR